MAQEKKIDLSRFREKFVAEARTRLARMNEGLARLEKGQGGAGLEEEIVLEAHTLKGAGRMLGFSGIAELTQRFEEALSMRRDRPAPPGRELLDSLFLALGTLSRLVESLTQPPREAIDVQAVLDRLDSAQSPEAPGRGSAPGAEAPAAPAPRSPESSPAEDARRAHGGSEPGTDTLVEAERLDAISGFLTAAISHQMRQADLRDRSDRAEKPYRRMVAELLDMIGDGIRRGEVAPALENRIAPLLEAGKSMHHDVFARASEMRRREVVEAESLAQSLEDMRSEIMSIRMVPLSPLFDSLQPIAVSLARELGKNVEIRVRGGKTEIDRKVAEAISEPLTQILRNAIDHGIEPPDVRERCGKPAKGKISITATPKKGRVVIEVEDDGKGIDPQETLETAVRRGLVSEKAARQLDEREILAFVFRKGFSTADGPSGAPGRGIGLDAVRAAAEKFSGIAEIASVPGKGTRVVLELPFSMSVSRVLLVLSGEQYFGIPAMHSEGIRRFTDGDIVAVEGRRSLCIDGAPVPLVWLNRLLGLPDPPYEVEGHFAVIVRHSQQRMALVVDRVEGENEVVVRDLGKYLGKVQLFMGSTILGTGDVVLLLDVYDLMSAVRLRAEALPGGAAPRNRPAAAGDAAAPDRDRP
jgi:two-component system chemotaxis sensor kinase CheA